jgi:hypothetical protein
MIGWIVFGCIVLLFVLLFTVHAYVTIEAADELALTVRILGIPIRILPKKPKKYKISLYTLKKIRKREAKEAKKAAKKAQQKAEKRAKKAQKKADEKAAAAKMTRAERRAAKAAKKAKKPALTDMIALVAKVAKLFFSRFFGKLHIRVARIHLRVGAGDAMTAAVTYGLVNQAVAYLMELLKKISHVDGLKKADVMIQPDFLSDKIEYDIKLTFRVSLGNVVGALLRAGWSFLIGYARIKPDPDHPRVGGIPKPPAPPSPPKPEAPIRPESPDTPL